MADNRRRPSSAGGRQRAGGGRKAQGRKPGRTTQGRQSQGRQSQGRQSQGRQSQGRQSQGRQGQGRARPNRRPSGGRSREQTERDEFFAAVDERAARAKAAGWGGVARRGTKNLHLDEHRRNVEADRDRARRELDDDPGDAERHARRAESDAARSEQRERLRSEARAAIDRGAEAPGPGASRPSRATRRDPLPSRPHPPSDPKEGIRLAFGDRQAPRMIGRLSEAAVAYDEERFADAVRFLRPLVDGAPDVVEVRELNGLALYRLGRWKQAAKELESFRTLSGSTEQHPVLADCYRAMSRWADVDELWSELREASPSAALVTEGRIVAAGALADRGDLDAAVALLGRTWRRPKRPRDHHLRRAYALADLLERAGDVPRARDLFEWIQRFDPSLGDVRGRLAALRS